MPNNIKRSVKELKGLNKTLQKCKNSKELTGSSFWQYTDYCGVKGILNSGGIWASRLTDTNDNDEIAFHKDQVDKIYVACFCNARSEQIPLWLLYSGMDRGYALGITPSLMFDTLMKKRTIKGLIDRDNDDYVDLELGKDVEIQFGYAFYKTKNDKTYKYRNRFYELNGNQPSFERNNFFIKKYPWEYEKEFRIVIINKTDFDFEKMIICLNDDYLKKLRIKISPNNNSTEIINYHKEILGNVKKENISSSDLSISMDLMKKNRNQIIKYLKDLCKSKRDYDIEYINDIKSILK